MPTRAHPLILTIHAATGRDHAPFLRRHLRRAHDLLRPPLRELSVAVVGDARMSRLHEQFMAMGGPTDVLTFELDYDSRDRVNAGEIVVNLAEARRQAARIGVPERVELLLYAIHGMLHLCGFDDRTDPAYRKMHRTEDDILTRLGFGPVFAKPPAARPEGIRVAPRHDGGGSSPRPHTRSGARR